MLGLSNIKLLISGESDTEWNVQNVCVCVSAFVYTVDVVCARERSCECTSQFRNIAQISQCNLIKKQQP